MAKRALRNTLPPVDEVPAAHLVGRALDDGWRVTAVFREILVQVAVFSLCRTMSRTRTADELS